jgi:hypothetical protein
LQAVVQAVALEAEAVLADYAVQLVPLVVVVL